MFLSSSFLNYIIDAPSINGDFIYGLKGNVKYGKYDTVLKIISHFHIISAVFNMQNMSGGVNQENAAAYAKMNKIWKCIFPQASLL